MSWQAIVDAFAVFSVAAMAWLLLLWRVLLGRRWLAMLMSAGLAAMALLPLSSWWYNPITSVACTVFALSSALAWRHPARRWHWVSWAAAAALLASAKPNVAGVLLLPVGLLFLGSRSHRGPASVAGVAALAGLEGLLRCYGMSLADFVAGYRGVAERGIVLGAGFVNAPAFATLMASGGLAIVLLPLLRLLPATLRAQSDRSLAFIGAVTVAAGVIAFITSGEVKLVDLVIVHAGLLIWALAVGISPNLGTADTTGWSTLAGRYLVALVALGISLGVGVAATRMRVRSIGPGTFFEYDVQPQPFSEGFLQRADGRPPTARHLC